MSRIFSFDVIALSRIISIDYSTNNIVGHMPFAVLQPIKLASSTTTGHAIDELVVFTCSYLNLIKRTIILKDNNVDLHRILLLLLMPMSNVMIVLNDG